MIGFIHEVFVAALCSGAVLCVECVSNDVKEPLINKEISGVGSGGTRNGEGQ